MSFEHPMLLAALALPVWILWRSSRPRGATVAPTGALSVWRELGPAPPAARRAFDWPAPERLLLAAGAVCAALALAGPRVADAAPPAPWWVLVDARPSMELPAPAAGVSRVRAGVAAARRWLDGAGVPPDARRWQRVAGDRARGAAVTGAAPPDSWFDAPPEALGEAGLEVRALDHERVLLVTDAPPAEGPLRARLLAVGAEPAPGPIAPGWRWDGAALVEDARAPGRVALDPGLPGSVLDLVHAFASAAGLALVEARAGAGEPADDPVCLRVVLGAADAGIGLAPGLLRVPRGVADPLGLGPEGGRGAGAVGPRVAWAARLERLQRPAPGTVPIAERARRGPARDPRPLDPAASHAASVGPGAADGPRARLGAWAALLTLLAAVYSSSSTRP